MTMTDDGALTSFTIFFATGKGAGGGVKRGRKIHIYNILCIET